MRNPFGPKASTGEFPPDHMKLESGTSLSVEIAAALAIAFMVVMLFTL
jgi:hypothetical protein